MEAAILAIGTELTRGELCDSNSCWLSEQLTELGLDVIEHVTVDDDDARIVAALMRLGGDAELVLVTGGLGPTSDDRTGAAAAVALGVDLVRDPDSMAAIEARYRAAGRAMPETNRKQADLPAGALALPNAVGTAPGFRAQFERATAFFMPGVPAEMRHLFARHIVPWIEQRVRRSACQLHLRTFGLPESLVAERLADLEVGGALHDPRITLGYRASFPEIEVKILARAESEAVAVELATKAATAAEQRLRPHVFGGRKDTLAAVLGAKLQAAGMTIATAESCTGGLVGRLLTDVAGSSGYYLGSIVAYHNRVKQTLLAVEEELLTKYGAVSAEVAQAMAAGALACTGADLAVSTTGIAGPGGGSDDKPVGTVWFGVARRGQAPLNLPLAVHRRWNFSRERVRTYSAYFAMQLALAAVEGTLEQVAVADPLPVHQPTKP